MVQGCVRVCVKVILLIVKERTTFKYSELVSSQIFSIDVP